MRNTLTVMRREFTTYFNSPIGYIYIIAFVLINAALFMTPFFALGRADMGWMFSYLPFLLCVFIPLITMRLWAEERKENTIELLLTFPMNPYVPVMGKFFASLAFFLAILFSTAPIPIMLEMLGSPDHGVIFASYLGTALLGAFFLAIGSFISGMARDQIVAAVISLALCFALCLSGHNYVVELLDGWGWRLGSVVKKISVLPHYTDFIRGIVRISEIIYFLAWTTLFLFLNGYFLEGRNRRGTRLFCAIAILLCLAIGGLLDTLLLNLRPGRFDWTRGKIHTLSKISKSKLKSLDAPVEVNIYITPADKMPSGYGDLEKSIVDMLRDMEQASDGKFGYRLVYLDAPSIREYEEFGQASAQKYLFEQGDFLDWKGLIAKIGDNSPLAVYIRGEFPGLSQLLQQYHGEPSDELKDCVVFSFNQLLKRETLYEQNRFSGIKLKETTGKLLRLQPEGKELLQLNRMLLQDAYPKELKDREKSMRTRSAVEALLEKGIEPFRVFAYKDDQQVSQVVYSSLGIVYREKKEVVLQPITPRNSNDLEYKIMSAIARLTRPRTPTVAIFAPRPQLSEEEKNWYLQHGQRIPKGDYREMEKLLEKEGYDVKKVGLTGNSPLPDHYDALVVLEPRELGDRQRWEIARALHSGKNVLIAVQNYQFSYTKKRTGAIEIKPEPLSPRINRLLDNYGVRIDENILLDNEFFSVIQVDSTVEFVPGVGQMVKRGQPYLVDLQHQIIAKNNDPKKPITGAIDAIPYMWGSALAVENCPPQAASGLQKTVLLESTKNSWKIPFSSKFSDRDFKRESKNKGSYPLMMMISGQFPDAYSGKTRPAWPKTAAKSISLAEELMQEGNVAKEDTPAPATLILIGSSTPFLNFDILHYRMGCSLEFLQSYRQNTERLFLNSVETLALGEDLIDIHAHGIKTCELKIDDKKISKNTWRAIQFSLVPLLLLFAGITRFTWRRIRREIYAGKVAE